MLHDIGRMFVEYGSSIHGKDKNAVGLGATIDCSIVLIRTFESNVLNRMLKHSKVVGV